MQNTTTVERGSHATLREATTSLVLIRNLNPCHGVTQTLSNCQPLSIQEKKNTIIFLNYPENYYFYSCLLSKASLTLKSTPHPLTLHTSSSPHLPISLSLSHAQHFNHKKLLVLLCFIGIEAKNLVFGSISYAAVAPISLAGLFLVAG